MIDRIVEQDGVVRAWWGPGEGGPGRRREVPEGLWVFGAGERGQSGVLRLAWPRTPPHPPRRVFVSASHEAGGEGQSADQTNSAGPGSWTNSSSLL